MIRGKRTYRLLAAGAAIAVAGSLVSACGSSSSGDGGSGGGGDKNVTIGWIPWDEDVAATHLWKKMLEDKGYTVKLTQADAGPIFAGMAKGGSNDPDMFLDGWLPNTHGQYWKQYGKDLDDVGIWYHKVYEQLAVPNFVSDVSSIADLKSHASEFGGKIVGIEPGAGEMGIVKKKVMPAYGLTDAFKLQESSTPAMLATLKRSIAQKKPVVVTLWKPHWAYTKYPIKALSDPKKAFGPKENIHAITGKDWAKDHSQVVGWLKKFSMNDKQLGSLESDIQAAGTGKEDSAVAKWLKANPNFESGITG